MTAIVQDLRYACRTLLKRPGFAAIVILTLAFGIGANTAIFSVVNAVLLRPLDLDDPDRLLMIWETSERLGPDALMVASYANFEDWKEQNTTFEAMSTFKPMEHLLTGRDEPERIRGACVTAGFFATLRVKPAAGRLFRDDDDIPGAANVAVLSDACWQRLFDGSDNAIGQTLTLDGTVYTVIGILPPDFRFYAVNHDDPVDMTLTGISEAEMWTPWALEAGVFGRRTHTYPALGRIKADVTMAQAQTEMDVIARRLAQRYPDTNTHLGVRLIPLHEEVTARARPALLILFGAVGLVLFMACVNVTNLLLAHGETRRGELAVRAALGAGRARLIRLLATESVLVSIIAGILGLLLASWGTEAMLYLAPSSLPRSTETAIDAHVLAFTLLISVTTGLAIGILPAFRASCVDLQSSLKEGGARSSTASRHRFGRGLVVCQIALASTVLVGSGLLLRSFSRLTEVDLGFEPGNVLTFKMSVPRAGYSETARRAQLYRSVIERVAALPGVQAVGAGTGLPMDGEWFDMSFDVVGRPKPAQGERTVAHYNSVSASYFCTLGIPLLKGRLFTDSDTRESAGVMLVNSTMARKYWPNEDPVGQAVVLGMHLDDNEPESYEIVGVVGDTRTMRLDASPVPFMYVPFEQQTQPFSLFAIRFAGDFHELSGAVRAMIADLTTEDAPFNFGTLDESVANSLRQRRFSMLLMSMFAAVAVILASVGLYGVTSCTVAERTREFGIRLALGAQRGDVFRGVFKRFFTLGFLGILIGLGLSTGASRVMESLLYEVSSTDPMTYLTTALLLGAVGSLAIYIPARRATNVDPIVALRCE